MTLSDVLWDTILILLGIDSIKMTLNRLTMMLCDDSVSIESNQISLNQFEQGDVEPIDHDVLR